MRHGLRWWRHLWMDDSDSRRAVPPAAAQRLARRVADSERHHTGEICVCVEASLPLNWCWAARQDDLAQTLRTRAWTWFGQLGVWDTPHNNGVLIYVLLAERAIEIVADRGLAQRLDPGVWQGLVADMEAAFRRRDHEAGLALAIDRVGELLQARFPDTEGAQAPNALPDAVILR